MFARRSRHFDFQNKWAGNSNLENVAKNRESQFLSNISRTVWTILTFIKGFDSQLEAEHDTLCENSAQNLYKMDIVRKYVL